MSTFTSDSNEVQSLSKILRAQISTHFTLEEITTSGNTILIIVRLVSDAFLPDMVAKLEEIFNTKETVSQFRDGKYGILLTNPTSLAAVIPKPIVLTPVRFFAQPKKAAPQKFKLFRLNPEIYQRNLRKMEMLREIVSFLSKFRELIKKDLDEPVAQTEELVQEVAIKFNIKFADQDPLMAYMANPQLPSIPIRRYCAELIIRFYKILMDIPYKYGRVNIEKVGDAKLKNVTYLISLGLANLATELETPEVIDGSLLLQIIDEMIEKLPLVLENFLYNQQKEPVYSDTTCVSKYSSLQKKFTTIQRKIEKIKTQLASLKSTEIISANIDDLIKQIKIGNIARNELWLKLQHIKSQKLAIISNLPEQLKKTIVGLLERRRNLLLALAKGNIRQEKELKKQKLEETLAQLDVDLKDKKSQISAITSKLYNGMTKDAWDKLQREYKRNRKKSLNSEEEASYLRRLYGAMSIEAWRAQNATLVTLQRDIDIIKKTMSHINKELANLKESLKHDLQLQLSEINIASQQELFELDQEAMQLEKLLAEQDSQQKNLIEELRAWRQQLNIYEHYDKKQQKQEQLQQKKEQLEQRLQQISLTSEKTRTIQFVILHRYQLDYERRNLVKLLTNFRVQLESCDSSIPIMSIIANLVGWYNESCSLELRENMNKLLLAAGNSKANVEVPEVIEKLHALRNAFMHILDDLSYRPNIKTIMAEKNWEQAMVEIKNAIIAFLKILIVSEKILVAQGTGGLAAADQGKLQQLVQKSTALLALFPEFPVKRAGIPLTSKTQICRFKSSIIIGKYLLNLIYEALAKDLSNDITITEIVRFFEHQQVVKYDALLQALGEALGNLRQCDDLTDIYDFDIVCSRDLMIIDNFVALVKEYRNARTHCGYYDVERFKRLLFEISNNYNEIITSLDTLYTKVQEEYAKRGQGEAFDKIYSDIQILESFSDTISVTEKCLLL